jgi:peroxiredoxin
MLNAFSMKKLILIICLYVPAITFAQQGKFVIKGKVAGLNSHATVYLVYNGKIAATVTPHNGDFEFNGLIDRTYSAYLTLNKTGNGFTSDNYAKFYLEAGDITITSSDSLAKAHITGTKNNNDNERYKSLMLPLERRDDQLYARDSLATEEQKASTVFLHELEVLNKALEDEKKAASKKFILDNPSSLVSLDALYSYATYSNFDDISALYDHLSPGVKNSPEGIAYAGEIQKMSTVAIGKIAPDFELPDVNNNKVSLSSFRGKYVLVDFWASWCPLCRQANPGIVKTYNEYKDKNFTILGVSLDKPGAKETWLKAIHHDGLLWMQVSELKFWQSGVVSLYHLTALPQNFLISPEGKIIARQLDGPELSVKLAEIFGK